MELPDEFRKQVKDALEHLYDTAHLETHPLVFQFATPASDNRLTRAQRLRTLLKESVETLRPLTGVPSSPEWRGYLALRYRYVQGMSQAETETELGVSLRQLQRELHKGLDAVAAILWEKREAGALTDTEWQTEFNQWEIAREQCEVATLLDDALWLIKPLLAERGLTLTVEQLTRPVPVFVDATLTRQALFKVLRTLVRHSQHTSPSLRVREETEQVLIVLRASDRFEYETDEDWQNALSLCEGQGGGLRGELLNDGVRFTLSLPCASQRRVLVIDDNAAIHQLFERYLAPHHFEVLHAHNGDEALRLARDASPQVITLDVMMPHTDGWQVLRTLAADELTAHIPVVICSVLKEPELAFSLGARAYLKKPVERLELLATLNQLLSPGSPRSGRASINA